MIQKSKLEADKYSVPSGNASSIAECATEYGIDIAPLCDVIGLDPATFSDLNGRIGLDRFCRLLETCALMAGDDAFGLRTTEYFVPGSTGPYGYGLMAAPTALDFFRFMAEHMHFGVGRDYARLTFDSKGAEISFACPPMIAKRDQFVDMAMGLLAQRLRPILGPHMDVIDICLERPKPQNLAFYREKFGRKVSFGGHVNSMRLPSQLYESRNPCGDEKLFRLMDFQCRVLRPIVPDGSDIIGDLREFILTRVADGTIGLGDAADYFHVSERTLQRRLAETGTSLADLRDEVRRDLARRLLSDTDLGTAEIAFRLGYSAARAFTRSTLRWFGKTPRDFRKSAH